MDADNGDLRFSGQSASGNARQHVGNSYTNTTTYSHGGSSSILGYFDRRKRNKALLAAAEAGLVQRVRVLLQAGADVDYIDQQGYTPLHKACFSGHNNVVKLLLEGGSDVNSAREGNLAHSQTPLQLAAFFGHVDVVTTLASTPGVDVNRRTYAHPPILTAVTSPKLSAEKRLAIVQTLISAGASTRCESHNYNLMDGPRKLNLLPRSHYFLLYRTPMELIRYVVIEDRDPALLLWLIQSGHHDKVNLDDLLTISAWSNHGKCAEILVEHGANPNNDDTILTAAIQERRTQTVQLLRRLGAKELRGLPV